MRVAIVVLIVSAFAAQLGARAETPPFQMSDDGLYRRESDVFEQLWVRKQFDVRLYHKVTIAPPFIQYRPLTTVGQSHATELEQAPVTTRQKESLQEIVNAAFHEELGKSRSFTLTNAPGPDVLLVRGDLLDVVSYVPENASGNDDQLTVPNVGQAILVLELHDSLTNAIMVRASNHVVAKREAGATTADQALRANVQSWAALLRERLDAAASIPPDKQ